MTTLSGSQAQTILIVDDTPANLGMLATFLKGQNFRVVVAQDGEEGLQRAELVGPDLILLDVMMPAMDGFETCRRLKANEKTREIPVIFMTALSDTANIVTGFQVGGVDYMSKPIRMEEALARIYTHLTLRRTSGQLALERDRLADSNARLEREIAERTTAERALTEKNLELAHVNKLLEASQNELTRFLAVASHDLRQPMHALSLYIDALSNYDMPESARSVLGMARQCARILDNMFLALLDISRLDALMIKPNIKRFPIAPLLASIYVEFAPQATAKGLQMRIAPSSAQVESDPALVRQILSNFAANAVRYTASGTILIGCRRKGQKLRVAVFDTGIGISDDQRDLVFQEFSQVGNPGHDSNKGLGLGLAIVQRLATLLAAPITLLSKIDHGSMFAVDLPCVDGRTPSQAPVFLAVSDPMLKTKRNQLTGKLIVVIDDERTVLGAMRILLAQWGCRAIVATSSEKALVSLAEFEQVPDAIICDLGLHMDQNNLNAVNVLQEEYNCIIPTLIITGTVAPMPFLETLATDIPVLHKPLSADTLFDTLVRIVGAA